MPTYTKRKGKNGKIKIKALARIWMNGKQVSHSRTFETREEAEEWAIATENALRVEKVQMLYGFSTHGDSVETHIPNMKIILPDDQESGMTIKEFINGMGSALTNIERIMGKTKLLMLNTSTLINYFLTRNQETSSIKEIEKEKAVLKQIISGQKGSGSKRSNIVQLAYDVAITDGAEFK